MINNKFKASNQRFVFIVGAPRSGTTWVNNMLSLHPEISNNKNIELHLFEKYIGPLKKSWDFHYQRTKNPDTPCGLPTVLNETEFLDILQIILDRVYKNILGNGEFVILDKEPLNTNHLDLIKYLIPKSKFIWIIRDGRDVAVSLMRMKKQSDFGVNDGGNAALYWKKSIENFERFFINNKENIFQIRYEHLLEKNKFDFLQQIFNFIGIDSSNTAIDNIINDTNFSKKVSFSDPNLDENRHVPGFIWKNHLKTIDRYLFQRHCGDFLHKYGYETKKNWWVFNWHDYIKVGIFHIKNLLNYFK